MNFTNQDRQGFVILSETKDLRSAREMLRSAQHDKNAR